MGQSPIFVIKDVLAYLIQLSFLLGTISGVLLAIKIRLSPESADFYFFSIKMMLLIASAFVSLPYLRLQEAGRTQHLINVQAKVEISFHDLRKLFLLISFLVIFTASLLRRVQ
jgi:hypothetical protein